MLKKYARLYAPDPPPGGNPTPKPAAAAPAAGLDAPEGGDSNPFADIDAAFAAAGTPPPAAPAAGGAPPKPAAGDTPPKPGAAATPKPAPGKPAAPAGPKEPKQLREELDRVRAELQQATTAKAEYERQLKDFEGTKKEREALVKQIETEKQERLKLLAELRALKREASPEFKEKYDKPFDALAERAKSVIEKAQVNTPEGPRQATWNDFVSIWNMDEFAAAEAASNLFGPNGSSVVMNYYRQLHQLDDSRREAAEAERKDYERRVNEETANRAAHQQQIDQLWEKVNKDLAENVEGYHNSAEDTELEESRKKGYAAFDAQPKTMRERIVRDAHIRQRVAAYGPNNIVIKRQAARIAELEAELAKAKPNPPGGGLRRSGGAPPAGGEPTESFEEGLRKHMANA